MSDDSAMPEDDPRGMGTGNQQPEEQPGAAGGDEDQGPESGGGDPDAPATSKDAEGDAGQATGNPDAAGG